MGSGPFLAKPLASARIPDSVSQKASVYVYLEQEADSMEVCVCVWGGGVE